MQLLDDPEDEFDLIRFWRSLGWLVLLAMSQIVDHQHRQRDLVWISAEADLTSGSVILREDAMVLASAFC